MDDELTALRQQVQALSDLVTAVVALMVSDRVLRPGQLAALAELHRREAKVKINPDEQSANDATAVLADTILVMSGEMSAPCPVRIVYSSQEQ